MKNTQLQLLQENLDEINEKIFEIKKEINVIDIAVTSQDVSKLLSTTFNVDKYKHLPHKIVLSSPTFTQGRIHGEQLTKLFGALSFTSPLSDRKCTSMKETHHKSTEAGFSPPVKQLLDQPETVITIDTGYTDLYNVAYLGDNEIWTSGEDKTMKLFSINQRSLLKSITTKSGNVPYDIAVTKNGGLVYTDNSDRTVNIVGKEKIEVIRLRDWKPDSVCSTSSGELLVIMNSIDDTQARVVRYFGLKEKQTIQFDDKGKPLYSPGPFYRYVTENRNKDICVSDDKNRAVVVVSQAGKLRFRYAGHTPAPKNQPFSPRGITTDSQSHILTADFDNDCVHIIDQDGQFHRYIDCGLSEPNGLCTDTDDNLFVAQCETEQVKKIKYLQ
ncbi:protein wech-like [Saccostrea cucullata]|uniref:protein wech-like n=1 Tax=Saccostrea cuccullata TaxID=36930 RepID=UPI002ED682E7